LKSEAWKVWRYSGETSPPAEEERREPTAAGGGEGTLESTQEKKGIRKAKTV